MKQIDILSEKEFAARQYGKEKDYWLDKLSGDLVKSFFPYDNKNKGNNHSQLDSLEFLLPGKLSSRLLEVGTNREQRVHMILLAALIALLEKYTGNNDIIVGVPIYKQKTQSQFINTVLAIRDQLPEHGKMTFKELLLSIRQNMIEAADHQNYPIETLLYQLNLGETGKEFPLFDVMLLLENIHDRKYIDQIKCNMTFLFTRTGDSIKGKVEYSPFRYQRDTVQTIADHFTFFLGNALSNINSPLSQLSMISEAEKQQVLIEFNQTAAGYPGEMPINELFKEQAAKAPGKIAVVYEEEAITYQELDKMSDTLAAGLCRRGVKEDMAVGLMTNSSLEMVAGILGIIKANSAYLPIDPEYPGERQRRMIKDANIKVLLTNCENNINHNVDVIDLNTADIYNEIHDINFEKRGRWNRLAYIIYTSGSTGMPKGVIVEHWNVVRLVKNTNYMKFNEHERILQTGALEFDASTFEIWGVLLNGLTLYLVEREKLITPERLKEAITKYHISTIWMTSPLFNQMVQADIEIFRGLTNLLVGGDVLSPVHINRVRSRFPGLQVINGYGPTENTTFSTTFFINRDYESSIPIGSPIANSTAYILDKYGNLQPVNVPGELCVGGDGVARGYLNDPELTFRRFIDFNKSYSSYKSYISNKLYRTGDLARWLKDGNIEFLGRVDHQVKIRGFRVELGEIETRLLKHADINEVVILTRENEDKEAYLCAYFASDKQLTVSRLRSYLSADLPDYMIPSYFVQLEQLPINSNGKIHRKELPDPRGMIRTDKTYAPPSNDIEEAILQTWSDVLGIDAQKIGVEDDFFELGGNSINILKIQSRLSKEFGRYISMSTMFVYPTIRELAANIPNEPLVNQLEHMVKLNKSRSKKNIFIFHPLHGMTYPYKDLALLLEDEFMVYGIQGKGVSQEEPLPTDFNKMLGDYMQQIKVAQPTGPYILAGYCIGVMLAYEAARILEDENQTVEKVIVLDARAFIPELVVPFYRLRHFIDALLEPITRLLKKRKTSNAEAAPSFSLNPSEQLKQRVEKNNTVLSRAYTYKRGIHTPIVVIGARENPKKWASRKHWTRMTSGKTTMLETPGNHDTLLAPPHVETLAGILKTVLK